MAEFNPKSILVQVKTELQKAQSLAVFDDISRRYLGDKGVVRPFFREIGQLPEKGRKERGSSLNQLQREIANLVEAEKKEFLKRIKSQSVGVFSFDPDKPGLAPQIGRLHPLTQSKREIISIFGSMGFDVALGPEVEDEWHNFDALNIPKNHPARDAWNTVWIKNPGGKKLLLRTHTSPVQARYLMSHKPPFRIIAPGKVFRYEATDVRHEAQFYQLEGLMVDRKVSAANFKAVIGEFLKRFFGKDLKFRLRPDFFPFTEPSFDIAMTCLTCDGRGCPLCKKTGWLEVAGAGMVHPSVFTACGLDPQEWKGWAFGFGWDRLTMMKYKINDIRLFNSGNLRFLEQF